MLPKHQKYHPSPTSIRKALKKVRIIDAELLEAIRARDLEVAEKARTEIRIDDAVPSVSREKEYITIP